MNNLEFINISNEEFTLFEYKPKGSYKSFILDLNVSKQNPMSDIFFHMNKGNLKIVHIRKGNIIYSAGSNIEMQFQLLEAIIEEVSVEFNKKYAVDYILSYDNFSPGIFNKFEIEIEELLDNFEERDLIKVVNIPCMVCNVTKPLIVKRSFINNAESYPVPIVYVHEGHVVLCFIDKNFDVRGVELVHITG
ncbi:MAG: hypothetical protein KGD73_00735 [Candidatus Lokiarchaeota archaeon]|nr:hypothetical protein [Candidatus Lokiarchaeota archaeon]